MIGLLQRVREASVTVDGKMIAAVGQGLMVLVGVERGDTEVQAIVCWSACRVIVCLPMRMTK